MPVVALMLAESRARIARAVLKLPAPIARGWPYVAAIAAFAVFVSIGAAQPVLERERTRTVRNDAEALFVFDTTRSMAASSSAGSDTRFERAVRLGKEMRARSRSCASASRRSRTGCLRISFRRATTGRSS